MLTSPCWRWLSPSSVAAVAPPSALGASAAAASAAASAAGRSDLGGSAVSLNSWKLPQSLGAFKYLQIEILAPASEEESWRTTTLLAVSTQPWPSDRYAIRYVLRAGGATYVDARGAAHAAGHVGVLALGHAVADVEVALRDHVGDGHLGADGLPRRAVGGCRA